MRLVFDIETNGLLDREDLKIHCIVARDVDSDQEYIFRPNEIDTGVDFIRQADTLAGHNIAQFDIPVLERLYPDIMKGWQATLFDTLAMSRLAYFSCLSEVSAHIPYKLQKRHSLKAWGYRVGLLKGDFGDEGIHVWENFTEEMLGYCRGDVELNKLLFQHLTTSPARPNWPVCSLESFANESMCAYILGVQERNGVGFDEKAAADLYQILQDKRVELETKLCNTFDPWVAPETGQKGSDPDIDNIALKMGNSAGYTIPKVDRTLTKTTPWPVTYRKNCAYTKVKVVEFNPGSGHHVAYVLQRDYGWEPEEFTETKIPKTDEKVLSGLNYPAAKLLLKYALIKKRLGQLHDGKGAWINASKEGIIHGRTHTTGTRTSRLSHFSPNMGQVPANRNPWGYECRSLFKPTRDGFCMVGADASGLELRCLASRLAPYDQGALTKVVLEGDVHAEWMQYTGLQSRDNQKEFTYAMLYGAGKRRLGLIVAKDKGVMDKLPQDPVKKNQRLINLGGGAKKALLTNLPALDNLYTQLSKAAARGYIRALDGRVIACMSEHGALNDLLQSDGAIIMKKALTNLWEAYRGWAWAYPMLNVHDEWQWECHPDYAEDLGYIMVQAIKHTTEQFELGCPMDGEYKIGKNWSETH